MKRALRFGMLILPIVLLVAVPALAQTRPEMTIFIVWQPGEQLSSTTAPLDTRYVDVQILGQGNVHFWAMNLKCNFTPSVLSVDSSVDEVIFGPDWGGPGEFIAVGPGGEDYEYASNGDLTLVATRQGTVPSLGVNGQTYTILLATVRLRVAELTKNSAASARCTTMDFLDRDGNTIVRGRQASTPTLSVLTGYALSGKVLLQGLRSHGGISVVCQNQDSLTNYGPVTTNSSGDFNFNTVFIRETGDYICTFTGPAGTDNNFLPSTVAIPIYHASQYLLPVVLRAGNVDGVGDIGNSDIVSITSTWSGASTAVATPYEGNDANGDRRIDRADLAIVAGNYDPGTTQTDASHLLVGLATDYGGTFPNSQIAWGNNLAGQVVPLFSRLSGRNFWPALSPDGETVAYIKQDARSGAHELYSSPLSRPKETRVTPARGFGYQAFAPSWSPDGSRLAFVCSWDEPNISGYTFNEGYLCLINANGGSWQLLNHKVKITPPSWFDNNTIIYSGAHTDTTSGCANTLCYYDIAANTSGVVDADIPFGGANISDTPQIRADANGDTLLFYRYNNGTTATLRVAIINRVGGVFDVPVFGGNHKDTGISTNLDYYHVSPYLHIVYYERVDSVNFFKNRLSSSGTFAGSWGAAIGHDIDGFVGNPNGVVGFPGILWNGALTTPTELHAYRASMQWVP